ncbi:hypothetical protein AMATHDRAFT_150063 [Amanita thiersii Skay4041]|uniref:Protein kinase domain-containing protein n=1 Tax=Amanita thiersii Skay4041 TaxID=703135 RepID=A0A2A9NBI1_9AGAR|nr:hypothetical protein AMATHDRAFT_150063 [Amanita thiersii Skay4041]
MLLLHISKNSDAYPASLFFKQPISLSEHPLCGGGSADVFLGYGGGSNLAVKRLRVFGNSGDSEKYRKRVMEEIMIWSSLQHQNILPLFGIYARLYKPSNPIISLVSPWMENGSLIQYRKEHGLKATDAPTKLFEVARGMKHLHEEGIVHGDLKGGNILLDHNLHVKIADFGLSRHLDSTQHISTRSTAGTIRWMAPELLIPQGTEPCHKTYRSDVYAFACVILEIFTGKPPFAEIPDTHVVFRLCVLKQHPDRPESSSEEIIPSGFWDLAEKCWQLSPELRPTFTEIVATLETAS